MIDLFHTNDMNLVRSIMTSPDIWEQSVEDGSSASNFYPSQDYLSVWLLVKLKNDVIGVILVHNDSLCSVNIHPVLLSKYKRYGRDMLKAFFKWFVTLPDTLCKVNCSIPNHLKIVQNFAKKVGFKKEGINRASFFKNGIAQDQIRYGLTRDEIKGLIWALQ